MKNKKPYYSSVGMILPLFFVGIVGSFFNPLFFVGVCILVVADIFNSFVIIYHQVHSEPVELTEPKEEETKQDEPK